MDVDQFISEFWKLPVTKQNRVRDGIKRKRGRQREPERTNFFWLKWDCWLFFAKLKDAAMPLDEGLQLTIENYKAQGLTRTQIEAICTGKDRQIQDAIKSGI